MSDSLADKQQADRKQSNVSDNAKNKSIIQRQTKTEAVREADSEGEERNLRDQRMRNNSIQTLQS